MSEVISVQHRIRNAHQHHSLLSRANTATGQAAGLSSLVEAEVGAKAQTSLFGSASTEDICKFLIPKLQGSEFLLGKSEATTLEAVRSKNTEAEQRQARLLFEKGDDGKSKFDKLSILNTLDAACETFSCSWSACNKGKSVQMCKKLAPFVVMLRSYGKIEMAKKHCKGKNGKRLERAANLAETHNFEYAHQSIFTRPPRKKNTKDMMYDIGMRFGLPYEFKEGDGTFVVCNDDATTATCKYAYEAYAKLLKGYAQGLATSAKKTLPEMFGALKKGFSPIKKGTTTDKERAAVAAQIVGNTAACALGVAVFAGASIASGGLAMVIVGGVVTGISLASTLHGMLQSKGWFVSGPFKNLINFIKKAKNDLKEAAATFIAEFNEIVSGTPGKPDDPILKLTWKNSWSSTGKSKKRHKGLHEGFEEPLKVAAKFAAEVYNINQQLTWENRQALIDLAIERKDKTSLDTALKIGQMTTGVAKSFLLPVTGGGASLTSLGKAGGDTLLNLGGEAIEAGIEAVAIGVGMQAAITAKGKGKDALGKTKIDFERNVERKYVKLRGADPPADAKSLKMDTKVEVQYGGATGLTKWHEASIKKVNSDGTYDIHYNHGIKPTKETAIAMMEDVALRTTLENIAPGREENEADLKAFANFFDQGRGHGTLLGDTVILAGCNKLLKLRKPGDQMSKEVGGIASLGNNK